MQTVRRYLEYKYVLIMEKTFRSGTRESCVTQRSIYILLSGNEGTISQINQVRNVLGHLFSVTMYEFNLIKGRYFQTPLFSNILRDPI
jgi:hypothetical protein